MIKSLIDSSEKRFLILKWIMYIIILIKGILLCYTNNIDFLMHYPFFFPDSYDWLSNGINFFIPTITSQRQPGLPLIIYILNKINFLGYIPLLNNLVYLAILIIIEKTLILKNIKPYIINITVVIFLFNYTLTSFSDYILADYYALLFLITAIYLWTNHKPKNSILFLGISFLFQNFAPVILFVLILDYWTTNFQLKKLKLIISSIKFSFIFLIPSLPFLVFKYINFHNLFFTNVDQKSLILPNLDSLLYYLFNFYTVYGILGLFSFIFVFKNINNRKFVNENSLFLILTLFTTIFWVVVYEWNDRRFLLYLLPSMFFFSAKLIESIKVRNPIFLFLLIFLFIYSSYLPLIHPLSGEEIPLSFWEKITVSHENLTLDTYKQSETSKLDIQISRSKNYNLLGIFWPAITQDLFRRKQNSLNDYASYSSDIEASISIYSKKLDCANYDYYKLNTIYNIYLSKKLILNDICVTDNR